MSRLKEKEVSTKRILIMALIMAIAYSLFGEVGVALIAIYLLLTAG